MEKISLKDILTTYFPQILVILGSFGSLVFYFIKRKYDLASKKAEIKFGIFQEEKIATVQEFIKCYKKLEQVYWDTSHHKVVQHIYTVDQMDERFTPPLNNLRSAFSNLFLYYDKEKIDPFKAVFDSSLKINSIFVGYYFDPTPERFSKDTSELALKLNSFIDSNEVHILDIGRLVRSDYQ